MGASDKITWRSKTQAGGGIVDNSSNNGKPNNSVEKAEFWLRAYSTEVEGVKLPYDQPLDTMPMLKGSAEFAINSNSMLESLLEFASTELQPGEEVEIPMIIKIYRANKSDGTLPEETKKKFSWKK